MTGPNFSGKSCYAKQVRCGSGSGSSGGSVGSDKGSGREGAEASAPAAAVAAAVAAATAVACMLTLSHNSFPVCQVALITFLAHVGSFVPASSARVGLTDRIFTRLASREAAAVPQASGDALRWLPQLASNEH